MGLPVRTPASMNAPDAIDDLRQPRSRRRRASSPSARSCKPAVLDAPRLGCFNLHGSLLPRWRGAAPIQRAIMAGDRSDRRPGHADDARASTRAPILLSARSCRSSRDDTAASLHDRLAAVGADLLDPRPGRHRTRRRHRDARRPARASPTPRRSRPAEARIDWTRPAAEIDRHIRGLSPFPGAWFEAAGPRRARAGQGAAVPPVERRRRARPARCWTTAC